jgi:hypothetical protein
VTLTMPITRGSARSSAKRPACQIMGRKENGAEAPSSRCDPTAHAAAGALPGVTGGTGPPGLTVGGVQSFGGAAACRP